MALTKNYWMGMCKGKGSQKVESESPLTFQISTHNSLWGISTLTHRLFLLHLFSSLCPTWTQHHVFFREGTPCILHHPSPTHSPKLEITETPGLLFHIHFYIFAVTSNGARPIIKTHCSVPPWHLVKIKRALNDSHNFSSWLCSC